MNEGGDDGFIYSSIARALIYLNFREYKAYIRDKLLFLISSVCIFGHILL